LLLPSVLPPIRRLERSLLLPSVLPPIRRLERSLLLTATTEETARSEGLAGRR
jgi:hypothetical protein